MSNVANIIAAVTTIMAPDLESQANLPPEFITIMQHMAALAPGHYMVIAPEESSVNQEITEAQEEVLYGLDQELKTSWDGLQANSWGYGFIMQVLTPVGLGLTISVAGNNMNSASTFWVLPVGAI